MSEILIFNSNYIEPKGLISQYKNSLIKTGVNMSINNSGVMRHALNANYYFHQNRPIRAVQEGSMAIFDAITGNRK